MPHYSYISLQQVFRFKYEILSVGSSVWTLGPQLVVLFGKIVEPFGDGVLLEEVIRCGKTRVFLSWLLSVTSCVLSECRCGVTRQLPIWPPWLLCCCCVFPVMMDSILLFCNGKWAVFSRKFLSQQREGN